MGVDIGINGGIVIFKNGKRVFITAMPKIGPNGDEELDLKKICRIFRKYKKRDCTVIYEDLHALFNVSAAATFTFGGVNYVIKTLVTVFDMKHYPIQPKVWQSELWVNADMVYKTPKPETKKEKDEREKKGKKPRKKAKKVDTKATSLKAAKRLFPKANFLKTEKCTVPHNGIVDSYLLAEYGRRLNL